MRSPWLEAREQARAAVALATDRFIERHRAPHWDHRYLSGSGGDEGRARALRVLGREDLAARYTELIRGLRDADPGQEKRTEASLRVALAQAAVYVSDLTGQPAESAPFLAKVSG